MANQIYDAGYGDRTPKQFRKVLEDAGIDAVMDVRRKDTGARISSYRPENMRETLGMPYTHHGGYGRRKDETLDEFYHRLWHSPEADFPMMITCDANVIERTGRKMCYICCEKHAYVDGKVNCHRVYVAEAVATKLEAITGEEWEVVHLDMND